MHYKICIALVCSCLALGACTSTDVKRDQLVQKIDRTGAECTGSIFDITEIQFGLAFVDCGAARYNYKALPKMHYPPRVICAITFGPSTGHKGTGRVLCDNDTSGDLTYNRSDPKNIRVKGMLINGKRMDLLFREYEEYPNPPLPPDTAQ
jgi:hypothetical protein